jgi:hypothetical protein
LFLHSCCCIIFCVMTGFIQMPKGFKNPLKLDLENQFRKLKRDSYSFLSLPPFRPVGPFPFSPLAFPSPSFLPCWVSPSVLVTAAAALSHSPAAADRPGPLVDALLNLQPLPPVSLALAATVSAPTISVHGSVSTPPRSAFKGERDPAYTFPSPVSLHSHLLELPRKTVAATHRSADRPTALVIVPGLPRLRFTAR